MHAGEATEHHVITELDMASYRAIIRQYRMVADYAIVRDVDVDHEQIAVANYGIAAATVVDGASVQGAGFADDVVVADNKPRFFAFVLLILAVFAHRAMLEYLIALADAGALAHHYVRPQPAIVADLDASLDHAPRSDADISANFGSAIDERRGVDGASHNSAPNAWARIDFSAAPDRRRGWSLNIQPRRRP